MIDADVPWQRLNNQLLVQSRIADPADVVRRLGAVQAQDFHGAKWAIGQRMSTATDLGIETVFNTGALIRTHVLRPTWHIVAPEDLRWLLNLTAPRVHALNAYMYRQTELDPDTLTRASSVIVSALQDRRALTRKALGSILANHGMPANNLRLGYILMHAELEALICSGPLDGKQQTYALLDERVPPSPVLTHDEALAELAFRFFRSHGPARAQDLARWSSLSLTESRRAIALAGTRLEGIDVAGEDWWSGPVVEAEAPSSPHVRLLPNYDEYLSGASLVPRSAGHDPDRMRTLLESGQMDAHFLVIDGYLRGGWRRQIAAKSVHVTVSPWDTLSEETIQATNVALERYSAFLEKPLAVTWSM